MICYRCVQIFELCHTFKGLIRYLCIYKTLSSQDMDIDFVFFNMLMLLLLLLLLLLHPMTRRPFFGPWPPLFHLRLTAFSQPVVPVTLLVPNHCLQVRGLKNRNLQRMKIEKSKQNVSHIYWLINSITGSTA